MGYVNRTSDFRDAVQEKRKDIPEAKRRKLNRLADDDDPQRAAQNQLNKEYLNEAYRILGHIDSLNKMLGGIRKTYLNVDARSVPLMRQGSRNIDLSGTDQSWSSIKHLTNEERDQIDLQARVILSKCRDRIKDMETLEKRRTELVSSNINRLTRLLPARLRQDSSTAASNFVAAHHASITTYLNRRLAEASQHQKEIQEERIKRQLERSKTLGSGATRDAAYLAAAAVDSLSMSQPQAGELKSSSYNWLGGASSSLASSFMGSSSSSSAPGIVPSSVPDDLETDSDDDLELSESQIQQFETENSQLLQTVQDTLESVQQAEARLMDISNLQAELITHLTQQTELTDKLYDDAIATTGTVEKGNVQLREAKRRARDSRKWILLFLIGASFSLLFLHYY